MLLQLEMVMHSPDSRLFSQRFVVCYSVIFTFFNLKMIFTFYPFVVPFCIVETNGLVSVLFYVVIVTVNP